MKAYDIKIRDTYTGQIEHYKISIGEDYGKEVSRIQYHFYAIGKQVLSVKPLEKIEQQGA